MKTLLLSAAILLPSIAFAAGSGTDKQDKRHDGLVCRDVAETGSRLSSQRICMTREQWEASRRDARDAVGQAQIRQWNPKGS